MPSVIVVGSGIAGLTAALTLSATHDVTLVAKGSMTECNTRYAQGGIAAVLYDDDSPEAHILDTLRAGAGLCDYAAVETLCTQGPDRVRDLIRAGVPFDRTGTGFARGLEAAHSHARVLHAGGDATGAAVEDTLVNAVRASAVRILEHTFLCDLIVDGGRVVGVELIQPVPIQSVSGQPVSGYSRHFADTVVLATGGGGQLYRHTTNPEVTTGDGIAAAWRAGAELTDLEFFQFHPTALNVPGNFLVSEAVRGDGAVLRNAAGERFMPGRHPDAELAPRDVVARAIASEMAAQGDASVRLDATALGAAFLAERFPTIDAATRAAGFDWAREPIPVTPAAHYWMGGIASDLNGRTSLPGLYAVGECACTGVHGANRLASNSLLEGLVFAARAAQDIAAQGLDTLAGARYSTSEIAPRGLDTLAGTRDPTNDAGTIVERAALQQLMWEAAGVWRSAESLERAAETLASLRGVEGSSATIAQREDANLLELSRVLVRAALTRQESRGAHFRSDFSGESADFAHHLTWRREGALAC
jgi:L-aspartate oxidase